MSGKSLASLIAADIALELPSVYYGGRLTQAVQRALNAHLPAYAQRVRGSERATVTSDLREQTAQDILDEADLYAGDAAREFAQIFARIARGGEGR